MTRPSLRGSAPLDSRFCEVPKRIGYAHGGRLVALHRNPYGQLYWEHDVVARDVNGDAVEWDTLDLPPWWESEVSRPLWLEGGWNTGGVEWPADYWLVCDTHTGESWAAPAASAAAFLAARRRDPGPGPQVAL